MARPKKKAPAKAPGVRRPELLPNGKYRGWTYNPHTKKKGPSKTFADEVSADAWMRRAQAELEGTYTAAGVEEPRRRRARVGFAEYAAGWARTTPGEPPTRHARAVHARVLGRRWPELAIDEVDRPAIKAYMAEMEAAGLAPGTRRNRLTALRAIMAEAIEDGLRTDDPTRKIEAPARVTLRCHRPLTAGELERVLAALPSWARPAILLSHDAGLRISEVCGLRWRRLDLLHGTVRIAGVVLLGGITREYPKGKKALPVPLTARTLTALRGHQEHHPGGPAERVFREPGTGAELLLPARLRDLFNRAVTEAGIDEPAPVYHDLRHGTAHALVAAGVPMPVLRAVMRHATLTSTQAYMPEVSDAEARRWLDATQHHEAPEDGRSAG